MKIGLFGYGKMGKMVESLALANGSTIVPCDEAEVCIDFSHPSVTYDHIHWSLKRSKPLVIGTTGWESGSAKALVENEGGSVLFSPNFSLGVAKFILLLKQAKELFAEYECAGIEVHHSQKKDAPSGTACAMGALLDISFASVRCGRFAGKHEVFFDSPTECITLTHEAHNREGFAQGALEGAKWLIGKKGWYTLDDMLRNLYSAHHPL